MPNTLPEHNRESLSALTGSVTGIGSMPGTDPHEAASIVVGELTVPHVPELPNRGLGADMIGRAAGVLVDIGVDVSTTGYRIGVAPGRVASRIGDHLRRDLDAFEEAYEIAGRRGGGVVKAQFAGPLTLAAGLELANGHRVPRDWGALRDLTESLVEGIARYVADLGRRTGAEVVVQLDEPSMAAVVQGTVPALTKLDPVRAVPVSEAAELLTHVVEATSHVTVLHLCGPIEWDVVRRVPIDGAFIDIAQLARSDYDGFAELAQLRPIIGLGVDPASSPRRSAAQLAEPAVRVYHEIGLARRGLERATVTPACGLAGVPESAVRQILHACQRTAEFLAEAAHE